MAADNILCQLKAPSSRSQELYFEISILEIELQIRRNNHPRALELLEDLAAILKSNEADIYQRVKLMTLKSQIFSKAGTPQKGLSLSLRAASIAYRAKLLPALWDAIGAVCAVLNSVEEFSASARLIENILPQVLECEDCSLAAHTFAVLADAQVGMAGLAASNTIQRKEQLTKALESIDKSFDQYLRIEDVRGQCEMLAKKATIMHLNGDPILANDCAAEYLDIKAALED